MPTIFRPSTWLPLVLAGAAVVPAHAQRQRPAPPAHWPAFVTAFRSAALGDSVVGAAAVYVRDGQVTAREYLGMADRDLRQPVDSNTLFHWASITKTLTAVAIMQLRDRKLLSLDDPVTRWVPELRQVHDPWGAIDRITLRMLLSHSAGFQSPTWPYGSGASWEPFEPTRWEQLVSMMPYQRLHFEPGTRYQYSNPAFIYLARVIEGTTGDTWLGYIQKNIWTPLGMTRSYVNRTPAHLDRDRANSYALVRDSMQGLSLAAQGREFDPGITIPNGGWNAPVGDLVTWAAFLTGALPGDPAQAAAWRAVLAPASLEEMWRPVVDAGDGVSMGLSFSLLPVEDGNLVFHTGSQAGFRSLLLLDPVSRAAVVVVLNTRNDAEPSASSKRWTGILRQSVLLLRVSR